MKARIDVKHEEYQTQEDTVKKGLFGSKIVKVPVTRSYHAVYLYLEASEEEKATIIANQLDTISVEEIKIDNSERYEKELAGAINDLDRQIIEKTHREFGRYHIIKYTIADFLKNPYKRAFYNGIAEANEYAAKLKTTILPRIKEIMTTNSKVGPTSESFDL